MQIAMVGLGRMGANMVRRLMAAGHECVVHDVNEEPIAALEAAGAAGARSLDELVSLLAAPRHVWIMVPAAFVGATVDKLAPLLSPGDTIIDGGNSWYHDDVDRSGPLLADHGIHYLDVGTSGGIHGLDRGYCLMVGGDDEAVAQMAPVFDTLAPGVDAAPRTPGRDGDLAPAEHGWLHCGPSGAGHFVKMVHNGIEYGLMQAYAEGTEILKASEFDLDLAAVTEAWRHGTVIRSWLLDLAAAALAREPDLASLRDYVEDSGEGRWTVAAAIDTDVPAPIITLSLIERFRSRQDSSFTAKMVAALRREFGGHAVKHS